MDPSQVQRDYLDRLRGWRNRPEQDLSLGFLRQQFQSQVERPYKQLGSVSQLWRELVPAELADHCRLESFQRGVLRVVVDSSPALYALDRLLRGGVERELVCRHKGRPGLRRVQLRVGAVAGS